MAAPAGSAAPFGVGVPLRQVARLVVVGRDTVLLVQACDPARPELASWWELPGGGIEGGEDPVSAAVRETAEETGVVVDPALVGPVLWARAATFRWRGRRHHQLEQVRVARLRSAPTVRGTALTPAEEGALLAVRWWSPAEIAGARTRFYPGPLARRLPALLDGEVVDDPVEHWD